MEPLMISAIISVLLLIFILQRADIEFIVDSGTRVYLSLIFLKYDITPKKKGIVRQLRMLKLATPIYKALTHAISKSDIILCEDLLQDNSDIGATELSHSGATAIDDMGDHSKKQAFISDNAAKALLSLPLYITVYSLLAPISARAASFKRGGKSDAELYIKFSIRVISLINSAIIFLYYYIRSRIKKLAKA